LAGFRRRGQRLFAAPSHAAGAELVRRIGALTDAANHHPDVNLRRSGVDVRLPTRDLPGLSGRDVALGPGDLRGRP